MAGIFGLFSGNASDRGKQPAYSMEQLQQLYGRLQQLIADQQRPEQMVEVIRQITEALIWGEQSGGHDNQFFDFFCEKSILADFVGVLGLADVSKTVKVQLLQALSMLVQNIRRDTSLYYLFSNNYVNQLISTQLDWSDEEILAYYISFLKSLALRLNLETIKFFFNEISQQFPLYVEAIRFFGHREQMVRTAVRTLTLTVYSIHDESMRRFVLKRSSSTYFLHLAFYLRGLWTKMELAARRGEVVLTAIQETNEEHKDLLMYISDVLELGVPNFGEALAERLLRYALFPVLIGSLLSDGSAENVEGADAGVRLTPACALFVLNQVFDSCRSPILLKPLAGALLCTSLEPQLLAWCTCKQIAPPATYQSTSADVSGPPSIEATSTEGDQLKLPGDLPEEISTGGSSPRETLLGWLREPQDFLTLLVAGLFRVLVACEEARAGDLLVQTGVLAGQAGDIGGSDETCATRAGAVPEASRVSAGDMGAGASVAVGGSPGVMLLVAQALEQHSSLRAVTILSLARFVLDLAAEWAPQCSGTAWRSESLAALRRAERSLALQVKEVLGGSLRDCFLDIFAEEWELQSSRSVWSIDMKEACGNVRCLLPQDLQPSPTVIPPTLNSPSEWTLPQSAGQQAAKAVRSLLVLRRLRIELPPPPPPPTTPSAGSSASAGDAYSEQSPLHVVEEEVDRYREGQAFELDRLDRIVCGVVTKEGRHTRYLVLHKFLLLLVQPDLVTPGCAVVRTLAPVRCVESLADQTDPRTLHLGIWLPRGVVAPGEARADAASELQFRQVAEEQRCNFTLFVLTLSFEDMKRCQKADEHFRTRCKEVQEQILGRVAAFVDGLCS